MITGDAALTALHVACEVAICTKRKVALVLTATPSAEEGGKAKLEWVEAVGDDRARHPFDVEKMEALAEKFELLTTEARPAPPRRIEYPVLALPCLALLNDVRMGQSRATLPLQQERLSAACSVSHGRRNGRQNIRVRPKTNDALRSQADLELAAEATDEAVYEHVDVVKVFARMSPQGKSKVIRAIQARQVKPFPRFLPS